MCESCCVFCSCFYCQVCQYETEKNGHHEPTMTEKHTELGKLKKKQNKQNKAVEQERDTL